jgi:hypothetical protein
MGALRRRINRVSHWTGLPLGLPLVAFAVYIAIGGRALTDPDDRAEMIGAALFFSFVAPVVYLLARAVGWISAEIVD